MRNNIAIKGDELKPFVHGVLSAYTAGSGTLRMGRFTEKQLAVYKEDSALMGREFYSRATATSGISLEMITDSSFIGLQYNWYPATGHDFFSADIYLDGCLAAHRYSENRAHHIISADLPEGTHNVQIFLPWNVETELISLVLSEGSVCRPMEKKKRILAFGDSITQGYIGKHPSLSYMNITAREFDAEILNQAVGGYWFRDRVLDPALASWKPDLITVAYGTNDFTFQEEFEGYAAGAENYIKKLTEIFPDTKILGIMPIKRFDSPFFDRMRIRNYTVEEAHNSIRKAYAEYGNVTVLEDTFYPASEDFYAPDQLHPNDAGFLCYGKAVVDAIRKKRLL